MYMYVSVVLGWALVERCDPDGTAGTSNLAALGHVLSWILV